MCRFAKMHFIINKCSNIKCIVFGIILLAVLLNVCCDDSTELERSETDDKKDGRNQNLSANVRRSPVPSVTTNNGTRDSQLLSLLASRRRQLLQERLNTHLNTIANLSQKPFRNNTTFAQLEIRDANNTIVKRIVLDNDTRKGNKSAIRIETLAGNEPIAKEVIDSKDVKNLTAYNLFQDTKSRGGFLNNKRKDSSEQIRTPDVDIDEVRINFKSDLSQSNDSYEPEALIDPDEEFQVDESNHGVYFLNYTDLDNTTVSNLSTVNTTLHFKESVNSTKLEAIGEKSKNFSENFEIKNVTEPNNSSEARNTKNIKIDSKGKDENNTLFMSEEIYNHFRPLDSELPVEDMEPFLSFGQKILSEENLTTVPIISASTKSYNYINPPEKKKYTSRYSVTEKSKNIDEDEVNEDMDVSVVKNVIEKNKIRGLIKASSTRHINLVNSYRKISTPVTPILIIVNETDIETTQKNIIGTTENIGNITVSENAITATPLRNITRGSNRRRKVNPTDAPRIENITTTERASSTLVYTAVVTSVSITSSMKGQNKTDPSNKNNTAEESNFNSTTTVKTPTETIISTQNSTERTLEATVNVTFATPTTGAAPVVRSYTPRKFRTRIRTTTPKSNTPPPPTPFILVNKRPPSYYLNATLVNVNTTKNGTTQKHSTDLQDNETRDEARYLAQLRRQQSLLRRRRPTTTTTSTTTLQSKYIETATSSSFDSKSTDTHPPTLDDSTVTTEYSLLPIIATTKSFSNVEREISKVSTSILAKPKKEIVETQTTITNTERKIDNSNEQYHNSTPPIILEEEVVMEADKNYTASYVLAGLGFIPIVAITVFVVRNIYLKKTKVIDTEYEGYFEDDDVKKETPITPVTRAPVTTTTKPDDKWEFPRNKLRLQTLLGQGNFGQVWKAEADDLKGHDGLTRLVAVKTIKETATQKEKQELLHEIYIMQKIGIHPNVVTILACCTDQEPYLLVMEYVMCGKLLTYLRERRSRPDRFGGSGALTSRDLTVFAYCVARGMDYLSSKGIVHRDLAARNVLVDHNKLCKIADFGMSRELNPPAGGPNEGRPQRNALPVRWMAPEALLYNVYNHETDVWAYGILLWEIVTLGSTPYASMSGREVLHVVTEGYRLERPTHCKPQLYRTMYACWNADPTQRPPFSDIKAQLGELLENEPLEGNYVDLESFYQDSSVYSDPSAIIQNDGGISSEYSRELKLDAPRRSFHKNTNNIQRNPSTGNIDSRKFGFNDDFSNMRPNFQFNHNSQRMGGFGIRDMGFNNNRDQNFNERKDNMKLSGSSFHREREARENPIISRNSFNGNNFNASAFQRLNSRERAFQLMNDSNRNNRVSEFECDI